MVEKRIFLNVSVGFNFFASPRLTSGVSENNIKLNPWLVTGFIEGEGCFFINVTKNKKYKTGFKVELSLVIMLHKKDKALLEEVKNLFNVGLIYKHGSKLIQFRVQ